MFDPLRPWKNPFSIEIPLHPYFIVAGVVAIVGVLVHRYFTHEMCYSSDCLPSDDRILCMTYEEGEHRFLPHWDQQKRRAGIKDKWTLAAPATLVYEPSRDTLVAILDSSLTTENGKVLSETCSDARSLKQQSAAAGF